MERKHLAIWRVCSFRELFCSVCFRKLGIRQSVPVTITPRISSQRIESFEHFLLSATPGGRKEKPFVTIIAAHFVSLVLPQPRTFFSAFFSSPSHLHRFSPSALKVIQYISICFAL
jgi:hypothetical protein